jgi:AAA domain, putative AbiEii toxin, Type IV TA system
MANHIRSAQVNILDGVLSSSIEFDPGLNILCGENGTLKTKLLQKLRSFEQTTFSEPGVSVRVLAISPKRNAERRNIEAIIRFLRSNNRTIETFLAERAGAQINDQTFEPYPSLGDLFYALYEGRCKDGGSQREKMEQVTMEFNQVMKSIFNDYELVSEWDEASGTPRVIVVKKNVNRVPLEALSLGELEILSLVSYLYSSRDSYDVFLIDEPEIHLNWHLEEGLFDYLDQFCARYDKQIIVATHSRAIFKKAFLKKAQFLYWNDEGKVIVGRELTAEQKRRIAGEAIEIIRLGEFPTTTFFVEDDSHRRVIETLARVVGSRVLVNECDNAPNVRSLYKHSKSEGGWDNAIFLIDGDNMGNPFPGEARFICLDKYCIENYLLDFEIAAFVTRKTELEIRQIIFESIREKRHKILGKNKHLDFLFDRMNVEDVTSQFLDRLDASVILATYLRRIGMNDRNYLDEYLRQCDDRRQLRNIFPEKLIEAIQEGKEGEASSSPVNDGGSTDPGDPTLC